MHMCIYIYIYIHMCMCICMCVCIYIYIYIMYTPEKQGAHVGGVGLEPEAVARPAAHHVA